MNQTPAPDAYATAIDHREAGRFAESEAALRARLAARPDDAEALALLAEVLLLRRREGDAWSAVQAALAIDGRSARVQRALARTLIRRGRADDALSAARAALRADPGDLEAQLVLAAVLLTRDRATEAAPLLEAVISARPSFAEAYANRALLRQRSGDLPGALADAAECVRLKPHLAAAWRRLGALRYQLSDLDGAIAALGAAVQHDPAEVGYLINLAELYREKGDPAQARANLRTGAALLERAPDARQLNLLAAAYLDLGDRDEALAASVRSLRLGETPEARQLFVEAMKGVAAAAAVDDEVRGLLRRAVAEPWGRPRSIAAAALRVVRQDPGVQALIDRAVRSWPARLPEAQVLADPGFAALAGDPLFLELLASAPVTDPDLEILLTSVRRAMLRAPDAETPAFRAALAQQGFINEYVFGLADGEAAAASEQAQAVAAAIAQRRQPPVAALLNAAAYVPLTDLPGADALLEMPWPPEVAAVLRQQVREPALDAAARAGIPRLTPIDDAVSLRVREQYEANPYPRWAKIQPMQQPLPIERVLRLMFPRAPLAPVPGGAAPQLLVAGCGTGQHSIGAARRFQGAQVLAVDLSLASLGYAKRKSDELGLRNLVYGQADLLRIAELGRAFDVIECSGVLHHLADPRAGLEALVGVLNPGGVMSLGLYSDLARRSLEPARRLAAARGGEASPAAIREFRQALLSAPAGDPVRAALESADAYTISTCRDLLFHVQETRLDLARVQAMLDACGLTFLGFTIEPEVLAAYRRETPSDQAATDLAGWAAFEARRPQTFRRMYQFWVQKLA